MTQTRKTTKFISMILTLSMIIGVLFIKEVTPVNAAADRVSLYSSTITFAKYGTTDYEILVRTNDNATDQKVIIHYFFREPYGWAESEASYVTTLDDGSKIWKASIRSEKCQYAIEYIADGETFWDNNDGANYDGTKRIGCAPIIANRLGYARFSSFGYEVDAILQNYAYCKNVFVRYTTDGWNTYHDQSLGYVNTNADGSETWRTYLPVGSSNNYNGFEYAICYQVNGAEFWANNFGSNYDINYCAHQ